MLGQQRRGRTLRRIVIPRTRPALLLAARTSMHFGGARKDTCGLRKSPVGRKGVAALSVLLMRRAGPTSRTGRRCRRRRGRGRSTGSTRWSFCASRGRRTPSAETTRPTRTRLSRARSSRSRGCSSASSSQSRSRRPTASSRQGPSTTARPTCRCPLWVGRASLCRRGATRSSRRGWRVSSRTSQRRIRFTPRSGGRGWFPTSGRMGGKGARPSGTIRRFAFLILPVICRAVELPKQRCPVSIHCLPIYWCGSSRTMFLTGRILRSVASIAYYHGTHLTIQMRMP
mmetsp:Transcript_42841/g.99086  ORF Transcript_42841/g.99086 Transcript_42841/m.99086 type:complete len:285 (+) Transcript_42841:163-1017(+)